MPRTTAQAIDACAHQSAHGPKFDINECQKQVRLAFGVPSDGTPTAAADWRNSKRKHPTTDPDSIPAGGVIAWTGGSEGDGHRAVGAGGGMCWSVDILRPGYFDLVPIASIARAWPKLRLVGWTEDIDGTRVWSPMSTPATITVALGNFQSNPKHPASRIKADMRRMFDLHPDITLSCEIAPRGYRRALRKVAHNHGHPHVYGLKRTTPGDGRTENAVTLGEHLALIGEPHTKRLSDGRAKITPNRDMTIVKAGLTNGIKTATIGTHLVSEAWTHNDATTPWRKATWHTEAQLIKAKVKHLHSLGYTVIVGGDLNNPDPVKWHKDQIQIVNQGLMQLAIIPAPGVTVHVGPLHIIGMRKLTTDHPIIAAPITLTK